VNSNKLQERLKTLGIKYLHILDLAPTNEIREAQKLADKLNNIKKRERNELGDEFKELYNKEILAKYNLEDLFSRLNNLNSKNIILFCVEKEPCACHRSLISDKLMENYQIQTLHL
jgi:hypothetical protein